MMKLALLSFMTMALLQPGILSAGQPVVVSNTAPRVRVKEVQLGESTAKLKAELMADRGVLQIRREEQSAALPTNAVIAEIAVTSVGPCGFDFVTTPSGDLMWVFVQEMSAATRQPVCLVYPLIKEKGGNYLYRMTKRPFEAKQHDVPISLDLTALLRSMAAGTFQRGKPLALGRDARISDVLLESTNAASVVVTGNIGSNYSFRGTVTLGANNDVMAKDFAIEPARQNAASDPR